MEHTMRPRRVLCGVVVLVFLYEWITISEPRPAPVSKSSLPYVVIMYSHQRDDHIIVKTIDSILRETDADIHVWGYLPHNNNPRVHNHKPITTQYHNAVDLLSDTMVPRWVGDKKHHKAVRDDVNRVRWRSRVVLDAWATLTRAQLLFPDKRIVWIENDVILKPSFTKKVPLPGDGGFLSCYLPHQKVPVYVGSGAVCLMFGRDYDFSLLLGYHLVEPLDWILYRSIKEDVEAFDGAIHTRHTSTFTY